MVTANGITASGHKHIFTFFKMKIWESTALQTIKFINQKEFYLV